MSASVSHAMSRAVVQLRPVPASAGIARRFVDTTLAGWGMADAAEMATLLVSELVTNAILHARSDVDVSLDASTRSLRVEVRDGSPVQPVLRHYEDDVMTGRGLSLVDAFSSSWGVQPLAAGKVVWFELPAAS